MRRPAGSGHWHVPTIRMVTLRLQLRRGRRACPGSALRALRRGPPIAALLGMSVRSVERGLVAFGLDVGEHLYNPIGSVHGGVFCTLLDSAMGCAVHSSLGRGQAYTTLELKVNLVRALTLNTPDVTATGQVVSAGRRVATATGQITGPDGTLYAHATTTCLIFAA